MKKRYCVWCPAMVKMYPGAKVDCSEPECYMDFFFVKERPGEYTQYDVRFNVSPQDSGAGEHTSQQPQPKSAAMQVEMDL